MNLELVSVGVGLLLGIPAGFYLRHLWFHKANEQVVRDLNTRLTSLNLRLERSQHDLATTKRVVAKLLEERQKAREARVESPNQSAPLTIVLEQSDRHPLSTVRGIGPKMAVTLASFGINCLERLAELNDEDLSAIAAAAPALAERMVRQRWKEQAIALLAHPGTVPADFAFDTSESVSR